MLLHEKFQLPQLIETGFLNVIKQKNLISQLNINQTYYEQRTALHIAIISNQPEIAEYLLSFKPDLQIKDSLQMTVFDWIQSKGNKQIFNSFLQNIQIKETYQNSKSQSHTLKDKINILRAAQLSIQKVQQICNKQNPFIKDQFGRKAIHWAAISGNKQVFNFSIQRKFDPKLEDNFGFNSYHYISINPLNPLNAQIKCGTKQNINLSFQLKLNSYDVIVIGAGAAGIGAATILSDKGVSYIILEARDRIGGRLYSQILDGLEVDLGGCWVHSYSKNNPICKQVKNLKWEAKKAQNRTDDLTKSQLIQNISQKDLLQSVMLQQYYFQTVKINSMKAKQDISIQQAAKQFYDDKIASLVPHKKSFVDMLINKVQQYNAASISQLSGKHYQQQIDTGGNFLPEGSYSKLMKAIAKSKNVLQKVLLNKQIISINYEHQNQYCQILCKDGTVYYAKKVISSLPLGILKEQLVKFIPDLPQHHKNMIRDMGFGLMNKIIVSFQQPFWKQNPAWISIVCQEKGKYSRMLNYSTQNKHILCCFVTDDFARKISSLSDQQIMQDFINLLKKVFKKKQIKVKEYLITKWQKDPFSLGSYAYFKVGSGMKTAIGLRENINKKLWIVGEHTYGQHIGCAHGAYQTGLWAAEQILAIIKQVKFQ